MLKTNTRKQAHSELIDALEERIGAPVSDTDLDHAYAVYTAAVEALLEAGTLNKYDKIGIDIAVTLLVRALRNS